ncbi:hypothetical protein ACSQ67_024404 [Phaseolus vulgaris]
MSWRKMGIWGLVNSSIGECGSIWFGRLGPPRSYNSRLYKSQLPHAFHKSFADESMVYPPDVPPLYKGYRLDAA